MAAGDLVAEDRADHAVDVGDGEFDADLFTLLDGRFTGLQQFGHVDGFLQAMVLFFLAVATDFQANFGLVEDVGEIQSLGLPVGDGFLRLQDVHPANHLVKGAETELGHDLAQLLGHKAHEVDHVLRLAGKVLA